MIKHHRFTLALSGALLAWLASAHAQTPSITEYTVPTASSYPASITSGPDGNLWFTESAGNNIARISTQGAINEFPIPSADSQPNGIVTGPDGNLWFAESGSLVEPGTFFTGAIGTISVSGAIKEFLLPTGDRYPNKIVSGPDHRLWFTESGFSEPGSFSNGGIGTISPSGTITEFQFPGQSSGPVYALGITNGANNSLWFTEDYVCSSCAADRIGVGKITTAGVITQFPIAASMNGSTSIAMGVDGNLWFTEGQSNRIGKITPLGAITEFSLPTAGSNPMGISTGSDGNLWFTEFDANQIGRMTLAGVVTEFPIPTLNSGPTGITTGPDGNIWFTEVTANQIGKVVLSAGAGTTITAGFTGNWYDISESGQGFSIEVLPGNQMLAEWFVFAPNGGQSWIAATGPITGNTAVLQGFQPVGPGGRFPPNFNGSQLQNQPWGKITFTFTDCNDGTVSWQPTAAGYTGGSIPISRLTMPAGLTCP